MSTAYDTDAIIIGGGPAGIAAGLALRAQGIESIILDARTPPIDKACGEGLMPDALNSLLQLGIQVKPKDGAIFRGIRFCDAQNSVSASFPEGVGIGVRRTKLHELMVAHAESAGQKIVWNVRPHLVDRQSVVVNGSLMRARWLIGADGQTSSVRRFAGLEAVRKLETRYGFRRHYNVTPWTDHVEVHWSDCGQIYVTQVARDEICIALVTRDPHLRLDAALPKFPELAQRLAVCEITSQERGSVTTTRQLVRVAHGSVALVGDASGSVDAVTGEGMAMSFRQSLALAEAIKNGSLASYQSAHRELTRLPSAMASMLLLLDRFPVLRSKALSVMAASPEAFPQLLSVHVGHQSLSGFAVKQGPVLGWRLIKAFGT